MKLERLWSYSFHLGIYDMYMPVNYDRSLKTAFELLAPAPDHRVLDLGCGGGRLLVHSHEWLKAGGRLTAIDIDPNGVIYAMRRAQKMGVVERVTAQVCDMRFLSDLKLNPFDGALAHFAVYTLPTDEDRRSVLKQLVALLKPGARFVWTVPSEAYSARAILEDMKQVERERTDLTSTKRLLRQALIHPGQKQFLLKAEEAMDHNIFHRYTAEELNKHLHQAGFSKVQIERIYGGCGYRVIAHKPPVPQA